MLTYIEFKKQAGAFSISEHPQGATVGGIIGAGIGGLIYPLTSKEKSRAKRIKKAIGLILSGAIVGSHLGSAAEYKIDKITEPKSGPQIPGINGEPYNFKKLNPQNLILRAIPLPGDEDAVSVAKPFLENDGSSVDIQTVANKLYSTVLSKYGPDPKTVNAAKNAILDNADRYIENYKYKAVEIPQGGKPKKYK